MSRKTKNRSKITDSRPVTGGFGASFASPQPGFANSTMGYGGSNDHTTFLDVSYYFNQPLELFEAVFESGSIAKRIVRLVIHDALGCFTSFTPNRKSRLIQPLEKLFRHHDVSGVQGCFYKLLLNSRLYGDAFLVPMVEDADYTKPISNLPSVTEISWRVYDRTTCKPSPGEDLRCPNYYDITPSYVWGNTSKFHFRVHKSWVVRAIGEPLTDKLLLQNSGFNLSVLSGNIPAKIASYEIVNEAAKALTLRHSVGKLGVKGFDEIVTKRGWASIAARFEAINVGLGINNIYLHDMDREAFEFESQQYGGFDKLVEKVTLALISATDIPAHKLLNVSLGGAFSESSEGDRLQWAITVADYCKNYVTPALSCWLSILAHTPEFRGLEKIEVVPVFSQCLPQTPNEKAELRLTYAQTDSINISSGVYGAKAATDRYKGVGFKEDIDLPLEYASPQEVEPTQNGEEKPEVPDEEGMAPTEEKAED